MPRKGVKRCVCGTAKVVPVKESPDSHPAKIRCVNCGREWWTASSRRPHMSGLEQKKERSR